MPPAHKCRNTIFIIGKRVKPKAESQLEIRSWKFAVGNFTAENFTAENFNSRDKKPAMGAAWVAVTRAADVIITSFRDASHSS